METVKLDVPRENLTAFCRKWSVEALYAVEYDQHPSLETDLQFLVRFEDEKTPSFIKLFEMEEELSKMLEDRSVQIITEGGIIHSSTPIRREEILSTARQVFPEGGESFT
jgi:predicted nucleotidyltransferase